MLGIINRHGHSHFRCANHIDGSLIALENLEHLAQETVSEQHTAGFYLDSGDIVFGSYRLDLPFLRIIGNQCTRCFRIHRIEQANRYIGILGRLNTGRMKDLCTKIRQLGSFFEVQLTHRCRLVYDARIIVMHTVDIRPYLNFGSIDGGTDQ